ncbi:MAG: DUF6941 family protein [Longimicrobiales bacterium]
MELILSATCEDARVRPDGKLDLMGVFSQLQARDFPALQERMTVAFLIEWDAGEHGRHDLRADLIGTDGREVLTIEGHTEVGRGPAAGAHPQTRLIMPLKNVVFPRAGTYRFELNVGSTRRRGCSVHVEHAPDASAS